jgi:hypothetical protein
MGKGYAAAVTTAVALDEQQRYFAVEIGYSTALRITTFQIPITVALNTYYPWSLDVLEPALRGGIAQNVTLVMSNGDLTGVGALTGRVAELDIAQDSRGKTLKIYECTTTATGRTDTLVFDGVVDEFSAADDSGTARITGTPIETAGSRPGSNYCMSICRWREFGGDDCQYAGSATSCARTLVSCREKVQEVTFTGSGLDDCTSGGTFSGSGVTQYRVEIDGTGTPDTFRWSDSGGSTWDASTVNITGAAQTLNNGVQVTFAATTGHTAADRWDFQASWEDYFGNLIQSPVAGTVYVVNSTNLRVPQSYLVPINVAWPVPPAGGGGGPMEPPGGIADPQLD